MKYYEVEDTMLNNTRALVMLASALLLAVSGCSQSPSANEVPAAAATTPATPVTSGAATTPVVATPAKVTPVSATIPAGVQPHVAQPIAVAAPTPESAKPATPTVREPAVLLSSRKKDVLIVAMDFASSKGMDKSQSLDERRQYVAEKALQMFLADFAKKEKAGQTIKLMALSVPNRDDYARGDFRNMDYLAVFENSAEALKDESKSAIERLGKIEWREALKSP